MDTIAITQPKYIKFLLLECNAANMGLFLCFFHKFIQELKTVKLNFIHEAQTFKIMNSNFIVN